MVSHRINILSSPCFADEKIVETKNARVENDSELIINYHACALELCAMVNAYPYDVPDFMPDVICTLAEHANAPQPIAVSICRCPC